MPSTVKGLLIQRLKSINVRDHIAVSKHISEEFCVCVFQCSKACIAACCCTSVPD